MKSSKNPGPAIIVGVLVTLSLLVAYPVTYIIGPGLLKGNYQTIYLPGIPFPAGRNIKTWGFQALPVMAKFDSRGRPAPRHLMARVLWVGPFVFLHEAAGRR